MINVILMLLLAFASGGAIGVALIAVFSILDFISVLRYNTTDKHFDIKMEMIILISCMATTFLYLSHMSINIAVFLFPAIGLCFGIFIGIVSASLTDVIGIIPVISNKSKKTISLPVVIIMLTLGKTIGSFLFFIYT